jgi:3-oxoacyl-[acyl-carrier protein] reductase
MNSGLNGKLALITGASSGLGRACALALAAEGARVALAARRAELLDTVGGQAQKAGSPDARAYEVDLSDLGSVAKLLRDVRATQGDPDVLVANGGGPKPGGVSALSLPDFDAGYHTVMRPMLELVSGVVPAMRGRKWGRVVYLGSISVKTPLPNLALSNAFRAGVLGALKTLSREVAADGVTVNVIATGVIETDRVGEVYKEPETLQPHRARSPSGVLERRRSSRRSSPSCPARAPVTSPERRSPSTAASHRRSPDHRCSYTSRQGTKRGSVPRLPPATAFKTAAPWLPQNGKRCCPNTKLWPTAK